MSKSEEHQRSKCQPNLAGICPMLSSAELESANDNLRQYVALALCVFERLELDPEAYARFETLTASRRKHKINRKRPQANSSSHQ